MVKGFLLDDNGDVVIGRDGVHLVEGKSLVCQTCRQVLSTNHGEWFLNIKEGIDFTHIFTKNPIGDIVRDEVQSALFQVDDSLRVNEFQMRLDDKRQLRVIFKAKDSEGLSVEGERIYAYR